MNAPLSPKSQRIVGTRCVACGTTHAYEPQPYRCARCGGVQDVLWDDERLAREVNRERLAARRDPSIWRFRELLPVDSLDHLTTLRVGGTPLYDAVALRRSLGMTAVWIKDDGLNPTGSYKDRASAVGVAAALDGGHRVGACASTGNAASSFAGIGASMGFETVIFVPGFAPRPKVTQLLMYGARVFSVDGDYDQTYDLCESAIGECGWFNRNAAVNPFLVEGKKTAAFEIAEQLEYEPPDACVVAVGDGCIVSSLYKGFAQFRALGLTRRIPRLIGVQAEKADVLVRAAEKNVAPEPLRAGSYADSINVGRPRNALKALDAVRRSSGAWVRVSDDAIREAQRRLARETGVFGEPAGAASVAGLVAARDAGALDAHERTVVLVTGNGLKDIDGAASAVGEEIRVAPRFEAVREHLQAG